MDKEEKIHKISPKYTIIKLRPLTLENCIDVFEDRMNGWMLDWAVHLNKKEHAGFAALHIGLAYFESIAVFIKGKDSNGKSKSFFKFGFAEVYKAKLDNWSKTIQDEIKDLFYKQGRCGSFHSGIAKKEIGLEDGDLFTVRLSNARVDSIWVDRYKFIEAISNHLKEYVLKLRNPSETELRLNFVEAWKIFHKT